jgi:hypothetical protein
VNILTPNKGTGRRRKKTMFKHEWKTILNYFPLFSFNTMEMFNINKFLLLKEYLLYRNNNFII